MTGEKKSCRTPIMLSEPELTAIDDWRHERRIWSRGDAIRQLVVHGMNQEQLDPITVATSSTAINLPKAVLARLDGFLAKAPYFADRSEAAADLISRALDMVDGREDIVELDDDLLAGIAQFSGGRGIQQTAVMLLKDAVHAWEARREARDE